MGIANNRSVSENSRPEKILGQGKIHQDFPELNAERYWIYVNSCPEHAADLFVAPKIEDAERILLHAPSTRSIATAKQIETYVDRMERRGFKVLFVDELRTKVEIEAAEIMLRKQSGVTAMHITTGEPVVIFASKGSVSTTALFEEFVHTQQAVRGVFGKTADLQVGGKTLKLTPTQAGELDVVIEMRRILNNRGKRGHELMSEAQFQERLNALREKNLKGLKLSEGELQEIVNQFASGKDTFLK